MLVETRAFPPGILFMYEVRFRRDEPEARWKPKRLPWWTRRKLRTANAPPPDDPPPSTLPRGLVNQILIEEYAKREDLKAMLRVCKGEAKNDQVTWHRMLEYVCGRVPAPTAPPPATWLLNDTPHAFLHACPPEAAAAPLPAAAPADEADALAAAEASDRRADAVEALAGVLRVVDEERALPPQRVLKTVGSYQDVPLEAVLPYATHLLETNYGQSSRDRRAIRELRASTLAMKQEIHDMMCAAVRLLPGRGGADDKVANSKLGSKHAAMLPALLYDPDDDADGDAADGDDAAAAETDEDRKWKNIKKSQLEEVDHEQFFKELDDPETGGFECVARWLGKGIIR